MPIGLQVVYAPRETHHAKFVQRIHRRHPAAIGTKHVQHHLVLRLFHFPLSFLIASASASISTGLFPMDTLSLQAPW